MQRGLVNTDLRLGRFSKSGRGRSVAVDLEIDGAQPSSSSRRDRELGEREGARAATCRRRGAAARVGVDCGWPGLLLGTGGVAGDELRRRHGSAAVGSKWSSELLFSGS